MLANLKILCLFLFITPAFQSGCDQRNSNDQKPQPPGDTLIFVPDPLPGEPIVAAAQPDGYLSLLYGKRVALLVNQTSLVGQEHLADFLIANGVQVKKIFAPEHGFRGEADDGQELQDGRDVRTGLPVISIYGNKKKPSPADLADVDVVVFDIQDVGARFYTFISTMHYAMEACAENSKGFIVLDRPNPNGHYVDGPVLDLQYQSFVGMHPVPVVHGMTVGEYARMINGEGWLAGGRRCDLEVIKVLNYTHQTPYYLPVRPSPNLPNMRSVYLYPSLCFFEGAVVSVGRGTDTQFQVIGHPDLQIGDYYFTPKPMPGASNPPLDGKRCRGYDLTYLAPEDIVAEGQLNLEYLLDFYHAYPQRDQFFLKNGYFDKLAGGTALRQQIQSGFNASETRASWQEGLNNFKMIRAKYLLYP